MHKGCVACLTGSRTTGLLIVVVSTLLFSILPVVHASQDRHGAVFHPGNDPHGFQSGLTWTDLWDQFLLRGKEDQRLVDVEIVTRGTGRRDDPEGCVPPTFAGVWRHGKLRTKPYRGAPMAGLSHGGSETV